MRTTLIIFSLERGGAARGMSILANSWAGQDRDVTLLTLNRESVPAYPKAYHWGAKTRTSF